jgi:hypothetical protein
MTNLTEKARAGRINALQERAARRSAYDAILGDRTRAAAERRNEMPIFISGRARPETHAFMH